MRPRGNGGTAGTDADASAQTWSQVVGFVLEQNGERKLGIYWLLYEVVRGEHERCMDGKSSNIGYPVR